MYCHLLFTPTYLPSFSVCALNRHKNNLRSGNDEIRRCDARKKICPHRLKEMLKTSSKGKVWKVPTGLFFCTLTLSSTSNAPVQCSTLHSRTRSKISHCQLQQTVMAVTHKNYSYKKNVYFAIQTNIKPHFSSA